MKARPKRWSDLKAGDVVVLRDQADAPEEHIAFLLLEHDPDVKLTHKWLDLASGNTARCSYDVGHSRSLASYDVLDAPEGS